MMYYLLTINKVFSQELEKTKLKVMSISSGCIHCKSNELFFTIHNNIYSTYIDKINHSTFTTDERLSMRLEKSKLLEDTMFSYSRDKKGSIFDFVSKLNDYDCNISLQEIEN